MLKLFNMLATNRKNRFDTLLLAVSTYFEDLCPDVSYEWNSLVEEKKLKPWNLSSILLDPNPPHSARKDRRCLVLLAGQTRTSACNALLFWVPKDSLIVSEAWSHFKFTDPCLSWLNVVPCLHVYRGVWGVEVFSKSDESIGNQNVDQLFMSNQTFNICSDDGTDSTCIKPRRGGS